MTAHFPGSLLYPSGNATKGRSWNDCDIFQRCIRQVLDQKRLSEKRFYLILTYDSASTHMLGYALFQELLHNDIFCIKLAPKTTPYSQPLDASGHLRTMKSRLRLETLPERRAMLPFKYSTIAGQIFCKVYSECRMELRYNSLQTWSQLGFDPQFYRNRTSGDLFIAMERRGEVLNRRLRNLKSDAYKDVATNADFNRGFLRCKTNHQYQNPDVPKGAVSEAKAKAKSRSSVLQRVPMNSISILPSRTEGPQLVHRPKQSATPPPIRILRPKYKTPFGYVYRKRE